MQNVKASPSKACPQETFLRIGTYHVLILTEPIASVSIA
jgi:hypothetical protein